MVKETQVANKGRERLKGTNERNICYGYGSEPGEVFRPHGEKDKR